jgi:hypothetical protein
MIKLKQALSRSIQVYQDYRETEKRVVMVSCLHDADGGLQDHRFLLGDQLVWEGVAQKLAMGFNELFKMRPIFSW